MSDYQFWLILTTLIGVFMSVIGIGIVLYNQNRTFKIDQDNAIAGLKESQDNAVAGLKESQNNAVAGLKENQDSAVAGLKENITELKESQDKAIVELRADHTNLLNRVMDILEKLGELKGIIQEKNSRNAP